MNAEGYLTEGSKSNLFFVRKGEPDTVYTAPSGHDSGGNHAEICTRSLRGGNDCRAL